jgi:hypothetical protein
MEGRGRFWLLPGLPGQNSGPGVCQRRLTKGWPWWAYLLLLPSTAKTAKTTI